VNLICLKWGTLYGPEYVNRLYHGIKRNLSKPFRFICYTDDTDNIADGVECLDFPDFPVGPKLFWSAWRKFCVLREDVPFEGPSLFLDLDVLITGSLDEFFEYGDPNQFVIIHNWIEWQKTLFRPRPDIGNSSVFRFPARKFHFAYEKFLSEAEWAFTHFPTEQAYLTYCLKDRKIWWPDEWVRSFKRHCRRPFPLNRLLQPRFPKGARIIAFHGRPHPDDAIEGFKGEKPHHYVHPCTWIKDYWLDE